MTSLAVFDRLGCEGYVKNLHFVDDEFKKPIDQTTFLIMCISHSTVYLPELEFWLLEGFEEAFHDILQRKTHERVGIFQEPAACVFWTEPNAHERSLGAGSESHMSF